MGRIEAAFERLRTAGTGGLVTYVTAGDPDRTTSRDVLVSLARSGADVLEVGVPFSDPLADGPVIQRATERALAAGMTLTGVLELTAEIRHQVETPIVLFTYANPVLRMGVEPFARAARAAGADGVLVLDYPVEEAATLRQTLEDAELAPILLVSPTTSDDRIQQSAQLGRGFLYLISRLGVTGARAEMANGTRALVERVRRHSTLPVALGFGISHPEHVAEICRYADAAVVGSALVSVIEEDGGNGAARRAGEYVQWLKSRL
jgi:tryptophan synthase alpha chain